MIWCEPRVIITINKVVTGRFAPGKTDNITNGYAKIQKIIQKDCRNAENPHCIFRIFAVTARAPAGDSNLFAQSRFRRFLRNSSRPCGDSKPVASASCCWVKRNSSRPCGGQQAVLSLDLILHFRNNSRPCGGQQRSFLSAVFSPSH